MVPSKICKQIDDFEDTSEKTKVQYVHVSLLTPTFLVHFECRINVDNVVSTTISKSYCVAVKNKRRSPSLQSFSSECGTPDKYKERDRHCYLELLVGR